MTSEKLDRALKIVRLAGYRVSKPHPKRLTSVGPTCVVIFADGETCRMSTHCSDFRLDYERGIALCRAAWESRARRWQQRLFARYRRSLMNPTRILDAIEAIERRRGAPAAPAIRSCHFERGGRVIGHYKQRAAA